MHIYVSWQVYTSYTVLYCFKYWVKWCAYTCSCCVVCCRHPELCLHAGTWNSIVHLYLMHELLFTDILNTYILVIQRWIQDRLHLVDWPKYIYYSQKTKIWQLIFANNMHVLIYRQCIHMYVYMPTGQRLKEEHRHMEVDHAWPTELLKHAYELLFQTGYRWSMQDQMGGIYV